MKERVGTVYTMAPEVLQGEYTKQVHIRNMLQSRASIAHREVWLASLYHVNRDGRGV